MASSIKELDGAIGLIQKSLRGPFLGASDRKRALQRSIQIATDALRREALDPKVDNER